MSKPFQWADLLYLMEASAQYCLAYQAYYLASVDFGRFLSALTGYADLVFLDFLNRLLKNYFPQMSVPEWLFGSAFHSRFADSELSS